MMALPNGRRGQILALALLVAVLASVWVAVAMPLLDRYADRAELLAQQRARAQRMAALADALPDLQKNVAAGRTGTLPENALLQGSTDAIAGAALQQTVQAMASGFGVAFSSMETLPAQQEGSYRRIRLRVALSAPWPVLVHLLQSVEQAEPRMLIDTLDLHAPELLVHPDGLPLDADFTILAFRSEAPARAAP